MNEILKFVVAHMGFLWEDSRFVVEGSIGGVSSAALYLVSHDLRMALTRDKGQMTLDFQPVFAERDSLWFDVDLVHQMLEGRAPEGSTLLNPGHAQFVRDNVDAIERSFSPGSWNESQARLRHIAEAESRLRYPDRPL